MTIEHWIDSNKSNHLELAKFFPYKIYYSAIKIGKRILERQIHTIEGEEIAKIAVFTLESWNKKEWYSTHIKKNEPTKIVNIHI